MADKSDSISLDSQFDLRGRNEQIELATYVAALANGAPLPAHLPARLLQILEQKQTAIRANPDIATPEILAEREARDERRKRADDFTDAQAGLILQEQQRERAEWAQASHTFAGQTMTGTQWAELADDLKEGGAGRAWLLAYLMQKGKTPEEAEQTAKDMQLAASGMGKPEGDRKPEERAALKRVEADPESKETFDRFLKAKEKGFPTAAEHTGAAVGGSQLASTDAQADALTDGFASAPQLRDHHQAALAATDPLDGRIAQVPAQLATPQPAAAAGLDI